VDIIGSEPEKWKPETRETADHSLPYITAIALIDGEVTEKQFQPERFTDPKIWKFLENVKVERNAELSALYPGAVANTVHVDLVGGRRLTKRVNYPTGHAKNPLKDSQVEEKFNVLVEPMLGSDRARKIIDIVWKLDEAKNVDELMRAMEMATNSNPAKSGRLRFDILRRMSKSNRLRELIAKGAVIMPGVPNAAMARQVERAGFEAVYVSGAGMANATAGVPDIGLLTMTEVVKLAGYVAKAVAVPAIVDADTGFGGAENVARTIQELEKTGLAGCHIEDQEFPKRCGHVAGKSIVDLEEMVGKIKAAVAARRDPDFMIIARTDARGVEGFDSAVERAGEYLAAGADAIFPEALQSAEEFRDFAKEIDVPLLANMTGFGKSPLLSFQQLAEFGYRMVIFPQSAFRVSMRASEKFFEALKKTGTQSDWLDRMQTRQELYDLLDYDPDAESWNAES
jgi:methylisocitrate lyase